MQQRPHTQARHYHPPPHLYSSQRQQQCKHTRLLLDPALSLHVPLQQTQCQARHRNPLHDLVTVTRSCARKIFGLLTTSRLKGCPSTAPPAANGCGIMCDHKVEGVSCIRPKLTVGLPGHQRSSGP